MYQSGINMDMDIDANIDNKHTAHNNKKNKKQVTFVSAYYTLHATP